MGCPDENTLSALVDGLLSPEEMYTLDRHVDQCPRCAALLVELGEVLVPEAPAPAPGRGQIGRYRVLEELGAGGMGLVYLAYDPELDRKVALKLLRPEVRVGPDGRAAQRRLLGEARVQATLSHPNVLAVHDVGSLGDRVFIAMEFVRGQTLKGWVEGLGSRPWEPILVAMLQAGRGLAAAHEAGLVHRDIKPDNILVGDDGRVRVTDFGLARQDRDAGHPGGALEGTAAGLAGPREGVATRSGALVGTPAYMSPEQLAGERATARSDQFSFCVTLYEALAGRRPYGGETIEELATAMTRGQGEPRGLAGLPDGARRALLRGLSPRAEERFGSMTALLEALDGALHAEALPTPDRVTPRAAGRRRRDLGHALGAVGLTSLVAALALVLCEGGGDAARPGPRPLATAAEVARGAPPGDAERRSPSGGVGSPAGESPQDGAGPRLGGGSPAEGAGRAGRPLAVERPSRPAARHGGGSGRSPGRRAAPREATSLTPAREELQIGGQTASGRLRAVEAEIASASRRGDVAGCERLSTELLRLRPALASAGPLERARLASTLGLGAHCLATGGRCNAALGPWLAYYELRLGPSVEGRETSRLARVALGEAFPRCP